MGKNYVENSLKHFLKRKMKITLGFVVAFMISGTLGFADSFNKDDYPLMDENNGYLNAMEWLNGLGAEIFEDDTDIETDQGKKVNVSGMYYTTSGNSQLTGNITIKRKVDGTTTLDTGLKFKDMYETERDIKFSFNDSLISEKVKQNIENALEKAKNGDYKKFGDKVNDERTNAVNDGIMIHDTMISSAQRTGIKSDGTVIDTIINNGILFSPQGIALNDSKAINNGIIYSYDSTQSGGQTSGLVSNSGAINIELYNNGMIVSNYSGQDIYNNTGDKLFNNGVISSKKYGQTIRGTSGNNNLYNYGIMETKTGGQYIVGGNSSVLENYGTINLTGKGIETSDKKIMAGQYTGESNTNSAYNYGLIKVNDSYGMAGAGKKYNYGVIHSADNSVVFDNKGTTENKGIVITGASDIETKEWFNTGITLNADYTLRNTETAVDMIKDNTIKNNTIDNSSFGDKNIGYIHVNENTNPLKISDITAKRDEEGKITNKKLLGVVAEQNSTIFENTEENALLLDGIDITGYLINGGTLIDTNDKDLILSDVMINVIEDLTLTKGEKAIAVDLGTNGNLVLLGEKSEINGIIKGGNEIKAVAQQNNNLTTQDSKVLRFENAEYKNLEQINYTDVTLNGNAKKIETEFIYTSKDKENTITIGENFVLGTADDYKTETVIEDNSTAGNKVNYIIENIDNIHGNISLGAGENTVTVKNTATKYDGKIDLGTGDSDRFIATGDIKTDAEGNPIVNTFNYNIVNAETVELSNGTWGDWDNAKGKISFDSTTKSEKIPNLYLGENATMQITLKINGEGSDFEKFVTDKDNLGLNHAAITGTGKVKYLVGKDGIDNSKFISNKYHFEEGVNTDISSIFKVDSNKDRTVVEVKSAEDFGFTAQERIIYEAYLEQIKADGSVNQDVITQINNLDSQGFKEQIRKTNAYGTAYYTAGSVVAKDITETYVSAVQNFTKRAGKGEWLAQGKYVNSDTEFTGGSEVKGYDGDITGTVGMIEYGFTDNTSYGAVFGMGDSKMDIDGGGKLDGDNIYVGLYAKHETTNGIEFVADIGFMENDMESLLRNDFNFGNDGVSSNGKTFEKGTADSSTVSFGVKGRKDYRISDSVKLQPTLGARLTIINQEEAENPEMHFTIKEQDIMVFEGTAGMGIAKEIALSQGALELSAGAEYTFAVSSSTNDAEYTLFKDTEDYQDTHIKLEDTDAAENTGKIYFGADYEHENGVGVNGKYEMLWSDKGDDSRITAGVSYRF